MSKKNHVSLSHNEEFNTNFLWEKDLDENCVFVIAYDVEKDVAKGSRNSKGRE